MSKQTQTWRVVMTSGVVHEILAWTCDPDGVYDEDHWVAQAFDNNGPRWHAPGEPVEHDNEWGATLNPRFMVMEAIMGCDVCELRAPSEPTTAERVAAAVEVMRAKCEAACVAWRDSEHQCQEAIDAIEGCLAAMKALKP